METHNSIPFASALCHLIKKYCKGDAEKDADRPINGAIKESLRGQLTSIASKLLNSEHFHFHQLSEEEQQLWQQFDKSEVYEFITGEKTLCQNPSLTGLNLAHSLSTCLLELSSLLTGTFNQLLTKPNHQCKSLRNLCQFHSKLHPRHQLRLPNKERIRISLITNKLLPI